MMKLVYIFSLFVSLVLIFSHYGEMETENVNLNGKILYVGGSGPGNFTSIQEAINAAGDGDIIFVYDDTSPYHEHIIINKSVNLIGENRKTTIVDGKCNQTEYTVIKITANHVSISNFTINGGWEGNLDILQVSLNLGSVHSVKVANCDFLKFASGIEMHASVSNIIISNCTFYEGNFAISTGEKGNYTVSNCTFFENTGGISITGSNNIISNCTFFDNTSLNIMDSKGSRVLNNQFIDKSGLQISYSSHCMLRNNSFGRAHLIIWGHEIEEFEHDIDTSNTILGKPLYYFYNKSDIEINKNTDYGHYYILVGCNNITIRDLNLYGSVLAFSSNITFENCSLNETSVWIYLHESHYNSFVNCHFQNYYPLLIEQSCKNKILQSNFEYCEQGIQIYHSSNENLMMNCKIKGGGIHLYDAHNNSIINCKISHCKQGLEVDGNNNTIANCNITKNIYGIFVNGYYNKIYSNNFIDNDVNAFCYGWNIWNTKEGGNYWDDYRGFDLNKDGVGGLPYHIKTDIRAFPHYMESFFNFDWHPLMHPVKTL